MFLGAFALILGAACSRAQDSVPSATADVAAEPRAAGTPNRLADEPSPYLRLHANNPVDWYPWGPEALETARRENKPIFLSVGYSTCYWCHVMERESFSDPEIASLMNANFVNIKVDREERPDLDEIYMTATQVMTGRGGWPNSVFLTPDLRPFYAGTYFPPTRRENMPSFRMVVEGMRASWLDRRGEVKDQARNIYLGMEHLLKAGREPAGRVAEGATEATLGRLAQRFDAEHGGFGEAPKFPSPANLLLLLGIAEAGDGDDARRARSLLETTLDAMARGGLYDQIGGGFHRYATDRRWRVPHFEKMLYDNGSLLEVYARWHALTGDPGAARVVRGTAAFLARELTSPRRAFLSAIDAETDHREGAFYVWTEAQLAAALSAEERSFAGPILGFSGEPTFRDPHGGDPGEPLSFILHLPEPLAVRAAAEGTDRSDLLARLGPIRRKLLDARSTRPRPLTDDKILADWNGLAIAGLATAGRLLGDDDLTRQGASAADAVLDLLRPEGRLHHAWHVDAGGEEGAPYGDAYLADYAYLAHGLLALHRATGEGRWLAAARSLVDEALERLWDDDAGGFFTAAAREDLLLRSKAPGDGARPSPQGVAAWVLLDLASALDEGGAGYAERAGALLRAFTTPMERSPGTYVTLSAAADRYSATVGSGSTEGSGSTAAGAEDAGAEKAGAAAGGAIAGLEALARSKVSAAAVLGPAAEDGWRTFEVRLTVADGWHVNAHPASDEFLVATELRPAGNRGLRGVVYPEGRPLDAPWAEKTISVLSGTATLRGEIAPGDGGAAVELVFQACDAERCLPPVTRRLPLGEGGGG
ncbi:MAG: DUF255 domain-containing protein [Acidobacteriota bacterium]